MLNIGYLLADLAFEGEFKPDDTLHGFSYLDQLRRYLYVSDANSAVDQKRLDGLTRYMHVTLCDHVHRR